MRIRPSRLLIDTLIALAETGVALLLGRDSVAQGWPALGLTGLVMVALTNLPVVLRSKAPVTVFAVVHVMFAVYVALGYWPVVGSSALMLCVYTVAALRPARISVPCTVVSGGMWIYAGAVTTNTSMPSAVGQALAWPAILWWFGAAARRSSDLARQLRAEQEARARRVVTEERGRIARELHDVVAHHMAVISVQTGLARFVFDSDPDTARAALDTIDVTGKEALEELRRMLKVLRGADSVTPAEPMPGLARVDDMIERIRAGGVTVSLRVEGTPRPLASGLELCAYRVAQEALTNVLKHAPGASAEVTLTYEMHHLIVSITDDGEGVNPARMQTGGGHGLIGMRERAKLYGGTISIGPPSEEGGFAVRLTLPTSPRAAGRGDNSTV